MPEVGGEVVEELLQVGVVLLVPLVGVKGPYTGESTARPNGRQRKVFVERPWNGLMRGLHRGGVGELQCTVWKRAAGSIGEWGGADDGCPRRTGGAAAMACGGATSARAGARLGSRRNGAGAG
jgi:hypothetical protein